MWQRARLLSGGITDLAPDEARDRLHAIRARSEQLRVRLLAANDAMRADPALAAIQKDVARWEKYIGPPSAALATVPIADEPRCDAPPLRSRAATAAAAATTVTARTRSTRRDEAALPGVLASGWEPVIGVEAHVQASGGAGG